MKAKFQHTIHLPNNLKEKRLMLARLFSEHQGKSIFERCKYVQDITGLSRNAVQSHRHRQGWDAIFETQMAKETEGKVIVAHTEKGNGLREEAFTSVTKLNIDIRQTVELSLDSARMLLIHAARMIRFYVATINTIAEKGLDKLSALDREKIFAYEKKIDKYKKDVAVYLNPSSITKFLELLGYADTIKLLNEGDGSVERVTPDFILSMIEKHTKVSIVIEEDEVEKMIRIAMPDVGAVHVEALKENEYDKENRDD